MYHVIAEPHCHTLVSHHAYSTIYECVQEAKRKGVEFLAITDHGPRLPDGAHIWHFDNLYKSVPHMIDGVFLLRGAETNIIDHQGTLDLPADLLQRLDWVIASYHPDAVTPGTFENHTECWLAIAANPDVDVIGHCGDPRFSFDHETVCREFAKYGKIVEINNHSEKARIGSFEVCLDIVRCCGKYGVPVVLSTDAHYAGQIAICYNSFRIAERAEIDPTLILNIDRDRFATKVKEITGRNFPKQKG